MIRWCRRKLFLHSYLRAILPERLHLARLLATLMRGRHSLLFLLSALCCLGAVSLTESGREPCCHMTATGLKQGGLSHHNSYPRTLQSGGNLNAVCHQHCWLLRGHAKTPVRALCAPTTHCDHVISGWQRSTGRQACIPNFPLSEVISALHQSHNFPLWLHDILKRFGKVSPFLSVSSHRVPRATQGIRHCLTEEGRAVKS